ncbi:hypothetical protein [Sinomonas atrocyanea]|uniref:hypothetical protein n=1 Tax=Sinomonas atrocyanea TaxID=37927 RepID=UPI0008362C4E|nr:hypothetical protein [Sinomonas atrocyanea]
MTALAGQPAVQTAQLAVASTVRTTTSSLASAVEAAPSSAAPLLAGPLRPLMPVADSAASQVALVVRSVGDGVASAVADPASIPGRLPAPTGIVSPRGAPAPAGTRTSGAVPEASASAAAPARLATPAPAAARASRASGSAAPWDPVHGVEWAPFGARAGSASTDSTAQGGRQTVPLAPAPTSGTSGTASRLGGPSPVPLALAGSVLIPALLVLGRGRAPRSPAPASRTFDPGSTPG